MSAASGSAPSTSSEPKSNVAGARRVSRRWPLFSALTAVALAAALGALIAARAGNLPLGFDEEWLEEVLEHRGVWFDVPALVMDWLGGGIVGVFVVPLTAVAVLCLLRRFWAALFFVIAAAASAGLVQLLKTLLGRPRPEEIMVVTDAGSFPSGHVANAATLAVTLAIIVNRTWVWAAGVAYTMLMLLARTYLGAHWLSDTIGGLLLGVGVAVIAWAPFAHRLAAERDRPPSEG